MTQIAPMPDRAVLSVEGPDRVAFLQGLVSNDVARAAPGVAVFSALLSPQGKWLADFFILSDGERLLIDCEAAHATMLATKLTRFRLRSQVTVSASPLHVFVVWGGPAPDGIPGATMAPDPRLPGAGWRILATDVPTDADPDAWDAHRLSLGLPEGARDLQSDKTVLLEAGFDELNGVSWTKGCYMGQELTARTRYRGLLKRRLVPVEIAGPAPALGTPVTLLTAEVGEMRSSRDGRGIALLRLTALGAAGLRCGDAVLTPRIPAWMVLPETAEPA